MKPSVQLQPAIAQFVVYNANTNVIALRLKPKPPEPGEETEQAQFGSAAAEAEKYLIIPVVGGVPKMPGDCARESDYYKTIAAAPGDIIIESSQVQECEGDPAQCQALGISTAPVAAATCDTVTLYPSGSTGSVNCHGSTLYAVVNRPNLIHPPGSTPVTIPMEGRTGHMTSADKDSIVYLAYDTVVRVGPRAPDIVFPEGAVLALGNDRRLVMNAPATVRASTGQMLMKYGGQIIDANGTVLQTFNDNASAAATPPYALQAKRNFVLPQNYQIPTQPNPYVRLPVPEKQ